MATTTPNYGWPVPTDTDYVKDGAAAIEALGDAIDATVFGLPAGGLNLISTTTIGTAVSSVTVTGAFSATYDNYKILISGGTCTASNNDIYLQLGATATGYASTSMGSTYTGTASFLGNGTTNFQRAGTINTNGLFMNADLLSPYLAKRTCIFNQNWLDASARVSAGILDNTTSYTAFTIGPATGTITGGTIAVYGWGLS